VINWPQVMDTRQPLKLGLTKEQMSFSLLHVELAERHEADLLEFSKSLPLTEGQWAIAEYAAKATLHYYKDE